MATNVLAAEARPRSGRGGAQAARHAGNVPAVLYGAKVEATSIQVNAREFERLQRAGGLAGLVELQIEGQPTLVLVKEIQRQPTTRQPLHIDFHAVVMDQEVTVSVAIEFLGEPQGEQEGGVTQVLHHAVDVICLPLQIPASLSLDISGVGLNETLLLSDLVLPEGVALAGDPEETLLTVTLPAAVEEPAEDEEGEADEAADGAADEAAEPSGDDA